MGNSSSSVKTPAVHSPFREHIVRLFEELQEDQVKRNLKDGEACIRRGVLKGYFQCLDQDDFGQLLFSQIAELSECGRSVIELSKADFIHGFEQLMDQGTTSKGRLMLYTSVFSDGESTLPFTGLVEMFQISKRIAMNLSGNSEAHDSDMQTSADMLARSVNTWCLPSVEQRSSHLLNAESLWLLSTNLPLRFLSCARPEVPSGMSPEEEDKLCGNYSSSWTILYDSEEHGQSLNRFKHHCMGYRGPTVTLMRLGRDILAIALDVEWRESTSSWGNSDCRIVQLWPKFQVLRSGPNIVFFNARGRGLSSGIVFGQTSRPCVTLDEGLSSAKLHYHSSTPSQACEVQKIEVWGCGGDTVKQKQQEQQKWERRQAEKLQKVKLPGKWDENPDKAILEMAGITTNHNQR